MVICGNCRNRRMLNDEKLRLPFLVAFAKLRNATVSFVMRLSTCNNFACSGWIFIKFDI